MSDHARELHAKLKEASDLFAMMRQEPQFSTVELDAMVELARLALALPAPATPSEPDAFPRNLRTLELANAVARHLGLNPSDEIPFEELTRRLASATPSEPFVTEEERDALGEAHDALLGNNNDGMRDPATRRSLGLVRSFLDRLDAHATHAPLKSATDAPSEPRFLRAREGPCSICGVETNHFAGNPSLWPMKVGKGDRSGTSRLCCFRCVTQAVAAFDLEQATDAHPDTAISKSILLEAAHLIDQLASENFEDTVATRQEMLNAIRDAARSGTAAPPEAP